MITTRITFVLDQDGFPGWQLQELKQLCGYFHSIFVVYNITRSKSAKLNEPLRMMSLGSCRNDVCQLAIEGLDAELACMVLTEYLREHSTLFSTSHRKNHIADSLFSNHPAFHLPFAYQWYSPEPGEFADKQACLSSLSEQVSAEHRSELLEKFSQREQIASTVIAPAIAAPHIISEHVRCATIACCLLSNPMQWHCAYQPVRLVIGIVLPENSPKPEIIAITRLTRWIISGAGNHLLLRSKRNETIKGILLHVMARTTG